MKGHLTDRDFSFANDGPSLMVGRKNGVVAQLKQDNSSVIPVHCIKHRLQLVVSNAFSSSRELDSVDELLTNLFEYYYYNPKLPINCNLSD